MTEAVYLESGKYRAEIWQRYGANCVRLLYTPSGRDLLRFPTDEKNFLQTPELFGNPLLFPPNRIENGRFSFQNREYLFPVNEKKLHNHLHGALYQTPFQLVFKEKSRAVFRFVAQENAYLGFPHAFEAEIEASLSENGLTQKVSFTNKSAVPMPFGIGLHTNFLLPDQSGNAAIAYVPAERQFERSARMLPTGESKDAADFQKGFAVQDKALSALVSLRKEKNRLTVLLPEGRIEYELCEDWRFVMIYNGDGQSGFISLEPQSWLTNAPNMPLPPEETGLMILEPGETKTLSGRITWIEEL